MGDEHNNNDGKYGLCQRGISDDIRVIHYLFGLPPDLTGQFMQR